MYKILIKSRTSKAYAFYTQKIGTEEIEYETEYLPELSKMYKALLKDYTMEQIKLVHDIEPEVLINLEDNILCNPVVPSTPLVPATPIKPSDKEEGSGEDESQA